MSISIKNEPDIRMAKRRRKQEHNNESVVNGRAEFFNALDSGSIIIYDKKPNTTIKDLENFIKILYNIHAPECFIMNGEEYSGERSFHDLTRESYLYVPFQSDLDIEVRLFTMIGSENDVSVMRTMMASDLENLELKHLERLKYGVHIISLHKKKPKKIAKSNLQAFIPQILRGNTCDDANENKIDFIMSQRYKSPPINVKQNLSNLKQIIEKELAINLDNIDLFDLFRFTKLSEQLPIYQYLHRKDYTDYEIAFRFKQLPKENRICIVITQLIPCRQSAGIQINDNMEGDESAFLNGNHLTGNTTMIDAPPKSIEIECFYPDDADKKEQWCVLETFSHGCKVADPEYWTSHEVLLWLNYIRTSLFVIPLNDQLKNQLMNVPGIFINAVSTSNHINKYFRSTRPQDNHIIPRFVRHCELLLKYKLFYNFNGMIEPAPPSRVCTVDTTNPATTPQLVNGCPTDSARSSFQQTHHKSKGPQGRSKARREVLVSRLGGRREIQLTAGNLMDTKFGKSLYSGRNSAAGSNSVPFGQQHQHRKWTFFLSCLLQPELAKEVAWVDTTTGAFRLVDQDGIARRFGASCCQKPDMTYDKLSRGMRYDRSCIIEKVEKSYCWKFMAPVEKLVGLSVSKIVQKMYKYYHRRNAVYPADLLLKESLDKKNRNVIGHMELYVRDPQDEDLENRMIEHAEKEYEQEKLDNIAGSSSSSVAKAGYMTTDRRINFWINSSMTNAYRYQKRLEQGRLIHSVIPNEPEFLKLTEINKSIEMSNSSLIPSYTNMMTHQQNSDDSDNLDDEADNTDGLDPLLTNSRCHNNSISMNSNHGNNQYVDRLSRFRNDSCVSDLVLPPPTDEILGNTVDYDGNYSLDISNDDDDDEVDFRRRKRQIHINKMHEDVDDNDYDDDSDLETVGEQEDEFGLDDVDTNSFNYRRYPDERD